MVKTSFRRSKESRRNNTDREWCFRRLAWSRVPHLPRCLRTYTAIMEKDKESFREDGDSGFQPRAWFPSWYQAGDYDCLVTTSGQTCPNRFWSLEFKENIRKVNTSRSRCRVQKYVELYSLQLSWHPRRTVLEITSEHRLVWGTWCANLFVPHEISSDQRTEIFL